MKINSNCVIVLQTSLVDFTGSKGKQKNLMFGIYWIIYSIRKSFCSPDNRDSGINWVINGFAILCKILGQHLPSFII